MPAGSEWAIILLFILIPFFILPIILCVRRAEKVNRDKILWGILGFFFGYIAVLILYLLSDGSNKNYPPTTLCPYCGEEISFFAKKCKHCGEWIDRSK